MSRYVIANWKMYGTLVRNAHLLQGFVGDVPSGIEVGICAPAPYWFQVRQACLGSSVRWGGQDVSEHLEGAYTGEVAVGMLEDFECQYVILGHSERRQYHAESSELVARKLRRVMDSAGTALVPIVCIGESLREREAGQVEAVLSEQLAPVLTVLKAHPHRSVLLAYEPVWAIGTGVVAQPAEVRETHAWIAQYIQLHVGYSLPILYGGSVKADNAGVLIKLPHVDGFLVGGASLKVETFKPLLESCVA